MGVFSINCFIVAAKHDTLSPMLATKHYIVSIIAFIGQTFDCIL